MLELPEEIWRDVPSIRRLQASSHGRIRALPRVVFSRAGTPMLQGTSPTFGVITRASQSAAHFYFGRHIKKLGNIKVHRAVCEAFHGPAPFEGAVVLHINENALDNRPSNLRWGTQKENLNFPRFLEYCRSRTGEKSPTRKALSR